MATSLPLVLCELGPTTVPGLESYSPFCLKIHRALNLAGLTYTSRRGAPRDFRDLNAAEQLPILLLDPETRRREVVCDSTSIVRRIIQLAPHCRLEPNDPRARAEAWLWEDWADRAMNGWLVMARWMEEDNWPRVREAYFGGAPWFVRTFIVPRIRAKVRSSLRARDVIRSGIARAREDFERALDHLEARAPEGGFWVTSDRPSVADLAIFAQVHSLRTELTPKQARAIKRRPALTDWLDRVDEATRAPAKPFAPVASRPVVRREPAPRKLEESTAVPLTRQWLF
jgi:glutathione S-transferase